MTQEERLFHVNEYSIIIADWWAEGPLEREYWFKDTPGWAKWANEKTEMAPGPKTYSYIEQSPATSK